jgi:hypothetical protein
MKDISPDLYIQLLQSCTEIVALNPWLAPGVIHIWLFQSLYDPRMAEFKKSLSLI